MARTVLICGASVAGPALAFWLARYGFEVTVVEVAPNLRPGGYAVDFSGPTHLGVLERMGIREDLQDRATGGRPSRFVDERGRTKFTLPAEFTGGDLEVPRSEVAALLHEHSRDRVEYRFGDSPVGLSQDGDGVHVSFQQAPDQRFDLLIGADGLHSTVRRLEFDSEEQCVTHLGYQVAGWDVANEWGLKKELIFHNRPGTLVGLGANVRDPARADAYALFVAPAMVGRSDREQQHRILEQTFAGQRWEVPGLLAAFGAASDVYFDSVARAQVPRWSSGRVALLGDAACGATLSGLGTGLAVVAAYVLAGELATQTDHTRAFNNYERIVRPYANRCQGEGSPASLLAPVSRWSLMARDLILSRAAGRALALRFGGKSVPGPDLPNYMKEGL